STGVTGNMTALAGEKLGLFARTGQLSLKASEGEVEVQAQNGKMALFAEQKLTMSSASDISFAGKKRITLIGGGSYLRLEAGKIEYGTLGTYLRRPQQQCHYPFHCFSVSIHRLAERFASSASSMPSKPMTLLSRKRRK
ncbi:DUF2345 domain-containing protein, partial [Enterobacter cloacae]|uniref:DUF2345 domain-containing protein n=2 Tax=Enterobacter cloacae TaxID=550 RepID=UPI000AF54E01